MSYDTEPASADYTVDTPSGTVLTVSPPLTKADKLSLAAAGVVLAVFVVCFVAGMIFGLPF